MSCKAVILNDYVIKADLCEPCFQFLEDYGFEVSYYQDFADMDPADARKLMMRTEKEGPEAFPADEGLMDAVRDAEIVVLHMSIINKAVIDAMEKCKFLGVCRGGLDNVNVQYAKSKGITIANAAVGSADAVADTTVFLMIGVLRNLISNIVDVRLHGWQKKPHDMTNNHNIGRVTVGLIGFGVIGQRVFHRLQAFGTKVIVHDPWMSDETVRSLGGVPVSLKELMKNADVVSLHLRLSETTKDFIRAEHFGLMKPTAFFVNCARAGLVEEQALLDALREHRIGGAALDVFNQEPLPSEHPYYGLDNLIIVPHLGGVSGDTLNIYVECIAEEVKRYVEDSQTGA